MISFCKIFYASFIELLVLFYFLYRYFMGSDPNVVPAIIYSIAETAKANNLKPFDYFEYLLTEIPKHVDDKNTDFLAELLPWSDMLPENIRKPQKASGK